MSINGSEPGSWAAVPWRTIIASTAIAGVAIGSVYFVFAASGTVLLLALSGFIAIVLSPIVGALERRIGGRRAVASFVVMLGAVILTAGVIALFLLPLRHQIAEIITDLPG